MAKIIVEHAAKNPGVQLNVFVDEKKIGRIRGQVPLEVDVPAGDHMFHTSFDSRKAEGVGVPFSVAEGVTKKIRISMTMSAMLSARWHYLLVAATAAILAFLVGWMIFSAVRVIYLILAVVFLIMAIANYFLVNEKRRQNPKNYVEIEVIE